MLTAKQHLLDTIRCCDCLEGMRTLPGDYIDLTVTSPPFDEMREYGGHAWNFDKFTAIADELFRITAPGGVVVWIAQEQVKNGQETGTVSKQRLYFESIGFSVNHTMIMVSNVVRLPQPRRYVNQFQYALVLSKGRPRSVDLLRDRLNSTAGERTSGRAKIRERNGRQERRSYGKKVTAEVGLRTNVWTYDVGGGKSTPDKYAFDHPALMPDKMARDHIRSWSRPGDLVFDPMMGSATTCKMALLENRHYLGFEVHEPFFRLAERRMLEAHAVYRNRVDGWLAQPNLDDHLRGLLSERKTYDIIYADPPWQYKPWSEHPKGRSLEKHYHTLSTSEIMDLPVGRLAAEDSVLFLWTTGPFLREAQAVIDAWGFKHKTIGINWLKTRGEKIHLGLGYHFRGNSEICLLATRGRGLSRVRNDLSQVVVAPVTRHSEKPEVVRQRIEALYGPQRRIELFARRQAPGWDAIGDEIDGRDIRDVLHSA